MSRIPLLVLVLLIAAGAWRRDAGVPKSLVRAREVRKMAEEVPAEECVVAAPDAAVTVVRVSSSPRVRDDGEERERSLIRQVAALEKELQRTHEVLDHTRAAYAKALNDQYVTRTLVELDYSRRYAARLEADLALLEEAYVEIAARHHHRE